MTEHLDVVVVGAGISGIGAGYHLQQLCPDRSYTILEARDRLGGTWDLFRYPGVRSDSDMHTLGYSFKPWTHDKAIADGPSIMEYLEETVAEFGIDRHIRYRHRVSAADWSTPEQRWRLSVERRADDETSETVEITANFLFVCSGYYSYRGGHRPDFVGQERFSGPIIHPQEWPEDLDYAGKSVIVIGSGATAVTLVPAMVDSGAGHVTMLQRSPTYMVARPDVDKINLVLRKLLPERTAYALTRRKNIALTDFFYKRSRRSPDKVRAKLLKLLAKDLPPDQIEAHFTPTYDPWDQRLCLVPNGDLFRALDEGRASVVTDTIATFTETGIELASGRHLEADLIVTATGLRLVTVGEMELAVDGEPVDFSQRFTYRGLGYSDVPNLITTFGYINASWTLRADLTSEYVCRLLNHMSATGATQATPRLRPSDAGMPERPLIENFSSGYMQRAMPSLPRQGDREPWTNPQDHKLEAKVLPTVDIDDGVMTFTTAAQPSTIEVGAGH